VTYANPPAYERFMGRWSERLAPLFIQFAGVQDGQRILDVGCGTGSLARALLSFGRATQVVGIDPTEDFVSFAKHATPDPRAEFHVGIAESLPFPDQSFDAALALLVLQEMDEPCRAVREMVRATRRRGAVAACLWDFANAMPMMSLFWQAAESVAPEAVARRRAEQQPTRPGLSELVDIWTNAGLVEMRTSCIDLTLDFTSFDDYWLPFLAGPTPTCQFAVAVNRETGGKLGSELRRIIPNMRPDDSFALPARALAVAGRVDSTLRVS
jgi:ubiquinone/menaquinone biosynthesis C-methylase UbiE